jgi:hypothetical protein
LSTENIRIKYDVDKKELDASNKSLAKTVKLNNLTQKEVDETTAKFKKQEQQLSKTNKRFSGLGDQLKMTANRFQIAGKGAGDMAAGMFRGASATGKMSKSLKILRTAIIATGIGALVIALGSLVAAFRSTQGGIDKINKALAPLKGGFQAIIGVVQDLAVNIFSQLKDRFTIASNGIQSGLVKIRLLWNKVTGDTEEVNQLIEKQEGLTKETEAAQERLNKKTEALADIWKGANDRIKQGAETQKEIERLTIAISRKQIDTAEAIGRARLEYEQFRSIAQDQNKSDQERIDALNQAEEKQRFIAQTEKEILDLKIEQLELSQSLNDTDREGEMELKQLKVQSFAADQEAQRKINSLVALRSGILKRQEAEALKRTQAELAAVQAQKDAETELEIFRLEQAGKLVEAEMLRREALLENEQLLAAERELIIADSEARITEIKEGEAETRKELGEKEVESDKQLRKSGADAIAGLVEQGLGDSKAAALFSAAINTKDAAIAAFKAVVGIPVVGPVLAPIAAGAATAFGLKNIADIRSTPAKFEKGGRIGGHLHAHGGTMIEAEKDEFVMSRRATEKYGFDFMDKINNLELNDLPGSAKQGSINLVDTKPIADQLKQMPQNVVNIDQEGFILHQRRGQDIINRRRYGTHRQERRNSVLD